MNKQALESIKSQLLDFCEIADSWDELLEMADGLQVGDVPIRKDDIENLESDIQDGTKYRLQDSEYVVITTNSLGSDSTEYLAATYGLEKIQTISSGGIIKTHIFRITEDIAYFVIAEYEGLTLYRIYY